MRQREMEDSGRLVNRAAPTLLVRARLRCGEPWFRPSTLTLGQALLQGIGIVRVMPQGAHLRAGGQQDVEGALSLQAPLFQHEDVVGAA